MSRRNKVNPDHYTTAGRLSPDDLARERRKQVEHMSANARERHQQPRPPWLADDATARQTTTANHERVATDTDVDAAILARADAETNEDTAEQRPSTSRSRGRVKASRATGTPKRAKAPRARSSAARKAASRGTQKLKSRSVKTVKATKTRRVTLAKAKKR